MKKLLSLALVGAFAAATSIASAMTLVLSGTIPGENQQFLTTFTGQNPPLTNTTAGPIGALLNGTQNFSAYCVDPAHTGATAINGTFNVTASPATGLPNGGRIAWLYDNYASLADAPPAGSTAAQRGGALQIAIWDVLTDNGDGIGAGMFRASTGDQTTISIINQYLAASAGQTASATWYTGTTDTGLPMQGMIGPNPAPEPATLATLGLGALVLIRRRKRA